MENKKLKKAFEFIHLLRDIAIESGATAIAIDSNDLIYDPRARIKCRFCKRFGKKATCPPNIPEPEYFRKLFSNYRFGLLVGIKRKGDKPDVGAESSKSLHKILLELERQAFERGYVFTISFIGGSCKLCGKTCKAPCSNPTKGRIPIESTGIDVIKTCSQFGLKIKFPVKKTGEFWRIGLVLIG